MKIQNSVVVILLLTAIFTLTVAEVKESAEAASTHMIVIRYYRVIKDVNGNICSRTYLGSRTSSYNHGHSGGTVYHYGTSTSGNTVLNC